MPLAFFDREKMIKYKRSRYTIANTVDENQPSLQFTQAQLSEDAPIRPRPIRGHSDLRERFQERLQANDTDSSRSFDRRNRVSSAFILRLPAGDQTSPRYQLPMKRYICVGTQTKLMTTSANISPRRRSPEPPLSLTSNDHIESTPRQRCSQPLWCSPPSIHLSTSPRQETDGLSVPIDILLPTP